MINKIEINNFQSHKNTVLEFDKGVNVICGESDNGKSAVIRAIRWVVENYPSGTEKINSNWNDDFKKPLSVKLYTEKGYVERIRDKNRNGYNICKNGEEEIKLDAIGRGVPKEVTDFLNVSDVNFQFQLDPPYLITKTSGEASKYLNEIVHLDSIDKIMSIADSDKRQLSSEQKLVEADIKKLEEELKNIEWVDEADNLCKRTEKLYEIVNDIQSKQEELSTQINSYEELELSKVDLTEHNNLIKQIEDIVIPDVTELEDSISNYDLYGNQIVDLSEAIKLVNDIDSIIISIIIQDTKELEDSISQYSELSNNVQQYEKELVELRDSLPSICPLCGNKLDKEKLACL